MARSLPENTVDAWTAISLADQNASWIWLPTTNAGATAGGTHPGDLSVSDDDRVAIIENKAIEAETSIDFGKGWQAQAKMLAGLQDAGHKAMEETGDTSVGWVAYGLPQIQRWDGSRYRLAGHKFSLVCPHDILRALPGQPSAQAVTADALYNMRRLWCEDCRLSTRFRRGGPYWPDHGLWPFGLLVGFSIGDLVEAMRRGLFGLRLGDLRESWSDIQGAGGIDGGAELEDVFGGVISVASAARLRTDDNETASTTPIPVIG